MKGRMIFLLMTISLFVLGCSLFSPDFTYTYINNDPDPDMALIFISFIRTNKVDYFRGTSNELAVLVSTKSNYLNRPVLYGESVSFTLSDGYYCIVLQKSNRNLFFEYGCIDSDIVLR